MARVYVFTMGGTAEFVVKPLFEAGVGGDVYVVVLYALKGDEYERRRVAEAVRRLEELAREAGFIDRVFFQQVHLAGSFYELVYRVAEAVFNALVEAGVARRVAEAHVWLTGGSRVLVIATLLACRLLFGYTGAPVVFHVWSEDGSERHIFDLPLLDFNLREASRARLELLKRIVAMGECGYDELTSHRWRESTVRKMMEHLRDDGMVECSRVRGHVTCKPTPLGGLAARLAELTGAI